MRRLLVTCVTADPCGRASGHHHPGDSETDEDSLNSRRQPNLCAPIATTGNPPAPEYTAPSKLSPPRLIPPDRTSSASEVISPPFAGHQKPRCLLRMVERQHFSRHTAPIVSRRETRISRRSTVNWCFLVLKRRMVTELHRFAPIVTSCPRARSGSFPAAFCSPATSGPHHDEQ